MASLPAKLSSASRRHYAQLIHKVCGLAVYPLRIIESSPLPRGWLPKIGKAPAKQYLYPDEDAQLAREGLRASEAAGLRLRDVDMERGSVKLDENKSSDPRAWALDPGVVAALRVWLQKPRAGAAPDDPLFVDEHGRPLDGAALAETFREDHLREAGVVRAELYEQTDVRRRIRVHDLRATFVTVSLANGASESWVADRTGHCSSIMINRYRSAERTFAELGLGRLVALSEAIPELAPNHHRVGHGVGLRITRPLGGTGRRRGFKILGPKGRPSSSLGGATS